MACQSRLARLQLPSHVACVAKWAQLGAPAHPIADSAMPTHCLVAMRRKKRLYSSLYPARANHSVSVMHLPLGRTVHLPIYPTTHSSTSQNAAVTDLDTYARQSTNKTVQTEGPIALLDKSAGDQISAKSQDQDKRRDEPNATIANNIFKSYLHLKSRSAVERFRK